MNKIDISTGEITGIIVNTVKLENKYMITQNDIFMTIKVLNDKIDQLTNDWNKLEEWLKSNEEHFAEAIPFRETLRKMKEIKDTNN